MAKVCLEYMSSAALTACREAVSTVVVRVVMSGGENWDTGEGSQAYSFTVILEG